jgi:hypothetical protein
MQRIEKSAANPQIATKPTATSSIAANAQR